MLMKPHILYMTSYNTEEYASYCLNETTELVEKPHNLSR